MSYIFRKYTGELPDWVSATDDITPLSVQTDDVSQSHPLLGFVQEESIEKDKLGNPVVEVTNQFPIYGVVSMQERFFQVGEYDGDRQQVITLVAEALFQGVRFTISYVDAKCPNDSTFTQYVRISPVISLAA